MSETVFKFLLSELDIIRVRHKVCNRVVEVKRTDLGATFAERKCPCCQTVLFGPAEENLFESLGALLTKFGGRDMIDIEFVLPAK